MCLDSVLSLTAYQIHSMNRRGAQVQVAAAGGVFVDEAQKYFPRLARMDDCCMHRY